MSDSISLDKSRFLLFLKNLESLENLHVTRAQLADLMEIINKEKSDHYGILQTGNPDDSVTMPGDYLKGEIIQILGTKTIERTKYYISRLIQGISEVKTNDVNDINLNRWKEYDSIITDSLWIMPKRDSSGSHSSWYWGNFIPQIPRQLMFRYTKKDDLVVDPFAGSGTTLLECQRLGRHGIGVELNKATGEKTAAIIKHSDRQHDGITTVIEIGDSAEIDFHVLLKRHGFTSAQLLLLHPPYHDIIPFSNGPRDLSAQDTLEKFLDLFGMVIDNTYDILDKKRYLTVVIGDKYSKGEWIPLGFYVMQEVLKRKYTLKSIIVKNFDDTLGKRNQKELWRYRALAGGFYIFKHEYIFVFQK
jgi:hypothetical protein